MDKQTAIYTILLLIFAGSSIYNFKIRKQCIYSAKLTKPRFIIVLVIPMVFLGLAYFVSDGSWRDYIIAILAGLFVISSMMGEGINEKGIYYTSSGTGTRFVRLAKWEDLEDINLNLNKNKLESFKLKTGTIFPDQYYHSKDIDKIAKYIKKNLS